jgi:hypothetical protein
MGSGCTTVVPAWGELKRPFTAARAHDDVAAAERQHPPCFRESRIVADQEADAADRRVDDTPIILGRCPAMLVRRQMRLAIDRDLSIRRNQAGTVVEGIAGTFGVSIRRRPQRYRLSSPGFAL